jgi:hypothetical protein
MDDPTAPIVILRPPTHQKWEIVGSYGICPIEHIEVCHSDIRETFVFFVNGVQNICCKHPNDVVTVNVYELTPLSLSTPI